MTAKRLWMAAALAIVAATTGCRTWCEHHYPCPQPVCAAPNPCCAPAAGYAPVPAAPPAAAVSQNWGAPRGNTMQCNCTCPGN
jgi:hypothetical protein